MNYLEWLLGIIGIYGAVVEPMLLQHDRLELKLPNLPTALDGFTAHIVADLHSTQFGSMERRVQAILRSEPVDIIFALGDFIFMNSDPEHATAVFQNAPSKLGVWGVLGNAEHKSGVDTDKIVDRLELGGIEMLLNESVMLEHKGVPFQLIGVDDPHSKKSELSRAMVTEAPVDAEITPYKILLAHAPQIVADPAIVDIDLVLSGHTHGGQIRIPGLGPLLGHTQMEYLLSAGLFTPEFLQDPLGHKKAPTLYVSRGIGTGFLHFRLNCRPEVTTVTLRLDDRTRELQLPVD